MMETSVNYSINTGKNILRIAILVFTLAAVLLVAGCSTGTNTFTGGNPTPTPTPAPQRLLVSDNTTGNVNVVNATTDVITHTIAVLSPGKMVSAGGTTLIQSTLASSVAIFDNATETIRFTVPLSGLPVDVAITPDGKTGWVAVNDGTIQAVNTATGAITRNIPLAGVQRLVMGPQGTTVLAFNDSLAINFGVIVPSSGSFSPLLGNAGLDHPANGVFLSDDNHFDVFNCGLECGGTQAGASGVVLGLAGGPFIGSSLPLSGATVGLLTGTTIFAAGSPSGGLNAGTLQSINTSTNGVSTPLHVADGRHNLMALTSNGRLYIGSTSCTLGATNTQNQRQGCLSIFDPVANTVTSVLTSASRPNGDITALAPVAGRNVIYVIQGGVVDIFDITTNAVSTTAVPPTISGTASGVVQLSP